ALPIYSGAVHPVQDVQTPLHVAQAARTSDGVNGTVATDYRFGGAKTSLDGRGFLGFRWIEVTRQSTGLKVRTEHRQDWPYVGLSSLVKKTQGSGTELSRVTNEYRCAQPDTCANPAGCTYSAEAVCTVAAGNRYFPFAWRSIETGNDLSGAALPTVTTTTTYDDFGNATSVT